MNLLQNFDLAVIEYLYLFGLQTCSKLIDE